MRMCLQYVGVSQQYFLTLETSPSASLHSGDCARLSPRAAVSTARLPTRCASATSTRERGADIQDAARVVRYRSCASTVRRRRRSFRTPKLAAEQRLQATSPALRERGAARGRGVRAGPGSTEPSASRSRDVFQGRGYCSRATVHSEPRGDSIYSRFCLCPTRSRSSKKQYR